MEHDYLALAARIEAFELDEPGVEAAAGAVGIERRPERAEPSSVISNARAAFGS